MDENLLRHLKHYHFVTHWGEKVVSLIHKHINYEQLSNYKEDDMPLSPGLRSDLEYLSSNKFSDIYSSRMICMFEIIRMTETLCEILKDPLQKIIEEMATICREAEKKDDHRYRRILIPQRMDRITKFKENLHIILDEAIIKIVVPKHELTNINKLEKDIDKSFNETSLVIKKLYNPKNFWDEIKLQQAITEHVNKNSKNWLGLQRYLVNCVEEELAIANKKWYFRFQDVKQPHELRFQARHMIRNGDRFFDERGEIDISQNEIFYIGNELDARKQTTIVSGNEGTGKSALLSTIFKQFHQKKIQKYRCLYRYDIMLYINLTEFRDYMKYFDSFLLDIFPNTLNFIDTMGLIKDTISKLKCLVLCDGFDNANENHKIFIDSLFRFQPESWGILITARPESTEIITRIVHQVGHDAITLLKILGTSVTSKEMSKIKRKTRNISLSDEEEIYYTTQKKKLNQGYKSNDNEDIYIIG